MKNLTKIMAVSLSAVMTVGILPVQDYSVQAKENENSVNYCGDNYEITYQITNKWQDGYNVNVLVKNTGDDAIEDWYIAIPQTEKITSIWNGEINERTADKYVVGSKDYNYVIRPNEVINFGYTVEGAFEKMPESFDFTESILLECNDDYTVEYKEDVNWGTGFTGNITITNNSNNVINGWELSFDMPAQINNIWCATIKDNSQNTYTVKSQSFNRDIEPGKSVTFGVSGVPTMVKNEISNAVLYSRFMENVEEEVSDEDIDEYMEKIDEEAKKDVDSDGISDYMEHFFGLDPDKADTDDDGLTDEMEITKTGTDGTLADTDGDGIMDGDEDSDEDGLTNFEEIALGTDNNMQDSDADGIMDGDEVNVYGTNPLDPDTDKDGVNDGQELELGGNPAAEDESFVVTAVSEEEDTVEASVKVELAGDAVSTLEVSKVDDELLFPETMPGYIGGAYEFKCDGTFEEAAISFKFDEKLLNDNDFDPVIYYFNEKTQMLEALDTEVEGNVATAKTPHFSKYILVNRKVYEDSFTWQDVWDVNDYSNAEIVLVVDDSGSLGGDYGYDAERNVFKGGKDPEHKRLEAARNFIDSSNENTKIGIVKFDGVIDDISGGLVECDESGKDSLKSQLQFTHITSGDYNLSGIFDSRGSTKMYGGIDKAIDMFTKNAENTLKIAIVFTDGVAHDTSMHNSIITKANNNSVKVYTVGLGVSSTYFDNYLIPLSNNTGGKFYSADNSNELAAIYDDISEKIDIETDSDGDGICDYYEENMVMFNGTRFVLDKNNPDSDGDGILDGKEVAELNYKYNEDKSKVVVTGRLLSNPLEDDSDYDGIKDADDEYPLNNTFKGYMDNTNSDDGISAKYTMDYRWFFEDNKKYNSKLSTTSVVLANSIYDAGVFKLNNEKNLKTKDILAYHGMEHAKTCRLSDIYTDVHKSEVTVGYKNVWYKNKKKTVIAVVVRGTNSSLDEWSSNFEIGNAARKNRIDWKNYDNHEGFDVSANRIKAIVDAYVAENNLKSDSVYWITGHSRGGGIANILGAYYEDEGKETFTYTFAAPNTTLSKKISSYKSIFNIVNADDLIPALPLETWGYSRYGRTVKVSVNDNYAYEWWINHENILPYNCPALGFERALDQLDYVVPDGDVRQTAYKYYCGCHGATHIGSPTSNLGFLFYIDREARKRYISSVSNMSQYCILSTSDKFFWHTLKVCQSPAYLMQYLATMIGKAGSVNDFLSGVDVAKFVLFMPVNSEYKKALLSVVNVAIRGIKHPHYVNTYYILSEHVKASQF